MKLVGALSAVLLSVAILCLPGASPLVGGTAHAQGTALCVSADGSGGCYSSIQAAVNAASPGATVSVAAGSYKEMVTISTPLRLVGAGAGTTAIDAAGMDNAVHITADGVLLQGFTITGSRLDGVLVNGNSDMIFDNTITNNASLVVPPAPGGPPVPAAWNGLNLQNSSNDIVAGNDVSGNVGRGIRTEGSAVYNFPDQGITYTVQGRSDHNLILNNTVRNNQSACGIVLSTDSSDNIVAGNTVTGNPAGIVVAVLPPFGLPNTPFADHVPHSDGNIVQNNTVQANIGLGINIDAKSGTDNGSIVANNIVSDNAASEESNGQTVGIQVNGAPGTQVDGTIVSGNTVYNQDIPMWVVPGSSVTNTIGIQVQAPSAGAETPSAGAGQTPAAISTDSVTISGFAYHPDPIVVSAGTTVTWTNTDTAPHSATADDGSFDTGLMQQGESESITFSTPGTYTYTCSIHPSMHGTITVQ